MRSNENKDEFIDKTSSCHIFGFKQGTRIHKIEINSKTFDKTDAKIILEKIQKMLAPFVDMEKVNIKLQVKSW